MIALSLAALACEVEFDPAALDPVALAAESAFVSLDEGALREAEHELSQRLKCLSAPLDPRGAAAFYRVQAIAGFASSDLERARSAFVSLRRLEPGYQLPMSLASATHPLRTVWEDTVGVAVDTVELEPPAEGWLVIDGVRGTTVPVGLSYVAQRVGADGRLRSTEVMAPGARPSYPTGSIPKPAKDEASVSFDGNVGVMAWPDDRVRAGRVLVFLEPRVAWWPVPRIELAAAGRLGFATAEEQVAVLPVGRLSGAVVLGQGRWRPTVGVSGIVMGHADLPVSVGAAGEVALGAARRGPRISAIVGYAAAPVLSLGVGQKF